MVFIFTFSWTAVQMDRSMSIKSQKNKSLNIENIVLNTTGIAILIMNKSLRFLPLGMLRI